MIRLLLALLLGITVTNLAYSQTKDERQTRTEYAVKALQEGGLVVRLTTNARKIAAMEARLKASDLATAQRKRLETMLADTKSETAYRNQILIQSLVEKYQLGPLYFLPDTALSMLNDADGTGVFVNELQQLDPSIGPPQGEFLIMRTGYSDPSNTSRAEGFILMDSALEVIPPPFPAMVTFNNAGFAINSLFAPEMAERRRIQTAVERLVKKLGRVVAEYGR